MKKKYEFTGETKEIKTRNGLLTVHQIRALIDLPHNVKKGDIGGWIQDETCLSHDGNCWISEDTCIYDNSSIKGDVYVSNYQIYDNVTIKGKGIIKGNDEDESHNTTNYICNHVKIHGYNTIEDAHISDYSVLKNAIIYSSDISRSKIVNKNKEMILTIENSHICNSNCKNSTGLLKYVCFSDMKLKGSFYLQNIYTQVSCGFLRSNDDILIITGLGSRNRTTTAVYTKDEQYRIHCGCFEGTLNEFINHVKRSRDDYTRDEYLVMAEMIRIHFQKNKKKTKDGIVNIADKILDKKE